jgi:hypothetical protein
MFMGRELIKCEYSTVWKYENKEWRSYLFSKDTDRWKIQGTEQCVQTTNISECVSYFWNDAQENHEYWLFLQKEVVYPVVSLIVK